MPYFFVHLENNTDSRDDEILKVKAVNKNQAKVLADGNFNSYKFSIGRVFNIKQLKKKMPEWHALLWGQSAINE